MSKRLGGIIGCKYKTSSWHLNGFPDVSNIGSTVTHHGIQTGSVVTLDQQYNVGERPTVILYSYINCYTRPPKATIKRFCICNL